MPTTARTAAIRGTIILSLMLGSLALNKDMPEQPPAVIERVTDGSPRD